MMVGVPVVSVRQLHCGPVSNQVFSLVQELKNGAIFLTDTKLLC